MPITHEERETLCHISRQRGAPVGDVLVEQGTLTREQNRGLERAVTYRVGRDEDKGVAKIIIDSKYCDPTLVEQALKKQKDFYAKTGELMRLGNLLVQSDDLTESQRIAAHKIMDIEIRTQSGSRRQEQ
jgi:hypothetical protein